MSSQKTAPVFKGAFVVMLGIIVSRLLGIVRETAFANIFGAERRTGAYFQAFRIPELFYFLMAGGALAAGFIPAFSERLAKGQREAAWELFRSLLTLLLLISTIVIGFAYSFSPALALLVGKGFDRETTALCASLMRIMLPAQIFFAVGGLFMGALNSFRAFAWSALAPGLYNLFIILAILFLGPHYGLIGVAWGVVAGAFVAQIVLQGPPLKLFGASFRPLWAPFQPGVKQVARLILPVTFGLCLSQINFIVSSVIAARLGPSSVSYFNYAYRIVWFPIGIFGSSLGISLLPSLSAHASLNEVEEFRRKIALGLRLLFFVVLLSASFLVLLRTEAIRLLLQSGRFSAFDTNETAMALLFFSPTVVFTSLQQLVVRAFYALQKPSIPVTTGAFSVLLCIALSLLFTSSMKLSGLTLANSLSAAINCCLLIFLLVRHFGGLELRLAFRSVITSLLSLLPSALVTIFCSRWCHANLLDNGKVAQALQLFIPLIFGSIAYLLAAYILRHPELAYLLRFLHRRKAYAR